MTGANYIPHEEQLSIISPNNAYLIYQHDQSIDGQSFENGKEHAINPTFTNVGQLATYGYSYTINSTDSYINIISGNTANSTNKIAQDETVIAEKLHF